VIAANNLQLQFFVKENSDETLNFGRAEYAAKMKRFNNQQGHGELV